MRPLHLTSRMVSDKSFWAHGGGTFTPWWAQFPACFGFHWYTFWSMPPGIHVADPVLELSEMISNTHQGGGRICQHSGLHGVSIWSHIEAQGWGVWTGALLAAPVQPSLCGVYESLDTVDHAHLLLDWGINFLELELTHLDDKVHIKLKIMKVEICCFRVFSNIFNFVVDKFIEGLYGGHMNLQVFNMRLHLPR